ncbi:MAG: class I SAM-dependent methyltransferase [Leptolyngbya sp. SIO3F4]|nr:class I SAM-dependent methyltransferase [Leptolyngbya sp. SIO3F4]
MNRPWMARTFGWIAPLYEPVRDLFFPVIRTSYRAFEHSPESPNRVLIAGGGTGDILPALRQVWPKASLTYLDVAPGMYQRAQRQYGQWENTSFVCASLLEYIPDEPIDTVVFPFVLDCLHAGELKQLREHLDQHYPALTMAYLLDFAERDASRWTIRKLQLRMLQTLFAPILQRWPRPLPDFSKAFPQGFRAVHEKTFWGGWIRWSVFKKET